MRRITFLAAVATLVALAACSSGDDDSGLVPQAGEATTTTPAAEAEAPACGEVFVDGHQISDQEWQTGCTDADGSLVVAASYGSVYRIRYEPDGNRSGFTGGDGP